jgi:hypothetical protein
MVVKINIFECICVLGLERGPLSLVSTIEELLGRENSVSCI